MAAEGLVDQFERYDMDEMADTAYWHAMEALQVLPPPHFGASSYAVLQWATSPMCRHLAELLRRKYPHRMATRHYQVKP
ncbi:hypothetical protein DBR24_17580 [Pseudomonas sp. HMWF006]|nr:hypothetical protein DBR24_17580 [Pseudomonas sp. HMWF006]PTT68523.1 hypothetical protein DBR26_13175 [Pseudomonas sp. HMWF007]PTT83544.1 hypothetical protein DBR29_25210 [Pseudomonas sp. HMWF005]